MDFDETPVTMLQVNHCITMATRAYPNVKPLMIKTILAVEGGRLGTISKNKNGSYDLGPMQINTIHLKEVKKIHGFGAKDLIFDLCKNIKVGAWLINSHLSENNNKQWLALGNYHSKTPSVRNKYVKKLAQAYTRIVLAIRENNEAYAIGRTTNWGKGSFISGKPAAVPSLDELEKAISSDSLAHRSAANINKTKYKPRIFAIDNTRKKLELLSDE